MHGLLTNRLLLPQNAQLALESAHGALMLRVVLHKLLLRLLQRLTHLIARSQLNLLLHLQLLAKTLILLQLLGNVCEVLLNFY